MLASRLRPPPRGCLRLPGAVEVDTFYLAQLVSLGAADKYARWWTWVGRERGASVSLEAVDSPSIHLRAPDAARESEIHEVARL